MFLNMRGLLFLGKYFLKKKKLKSISERQFKAK
jgi:hypothetical protein